MARRRKSSGAGAVAAVILCVPVMAIGWLAQPETKAPPSVPGTPTAQSSAPLPFSAPITPAAAQEAAPPTARPPAAAQARPRSLPPSVPSRKPHPPTLEPGEPIEEQLSRKGSYVNAYGEVVHRPSERSGGGQPDGATARCGDGTYSFSHARSGTCSRHGGVGGWLR